MVDAFDRVVIAVPDVAAAAHEYGRLLGVGIERQDNTGKARYAWVDLGNTVIELREKPVPRAVIGGLVFGCQDGGAEDEPVPNLRQLDIRRCDGAATARFRERQGASPPHRLAVDHLVLRTAAADACVELFRDQLGIRLALDQTVPEWGGRMLFFRAGKLTLEIIEQTGSDLDEDFFWGLALRCADIEQAVERMRLDGVALSEIRPGRKPGTRVATVKSHSLGIPTLLLQPSS